MDKKVLPERSRFETGNEIKLRGTTISPGIGIGQLLGFIIERSAELGKEKNVTICGEVASHPELVPLLLSLCFRSLSITPTSAKLTRNAIANTDLRASSIKPTVD